MTGHFFLTGEPVELNFKEYGSEGKELAEWKFGKYSRFKTFSATVIQVLRTTVGPVMIAGEVKEKAGSGQYEGETFTEWHVTAAWPAKGAKKAEQQKHENEEDLPF